MDYLYRVVYRIKEEYWPIMQDPAKNVWRVNTTQTGNRPYTKIQPAKSIATRENKRNTKYEFKVQRLPSNNWEFL